MTSIQVISLLVFIAVFVSVIALYLLFRTYRTSPGYELKKRLRTLAIGPRGVLSDDLASEILQEMSAIDRSLLKLSPYERLDRLIDQAGLRIDTKIFILIVLVFAFSGYLLGILLGHGLLSFFIIIPIFILLPFIYLIVMRDRRYNRFTEQLPDALDMVARSLKAGHSISSAVQMVGNEMEDPIAGLFKTVYDEQSYGLSLRDALDHMLDRMPSMDLRLFVTAINIHHEVGGNLAVTLERLAETVRDRIRIRRQVRVYTAQGRLSGYILLALPIVMAIILYFIAPDYLKELMEYKEGRIAIIIALIAQILGYIVIRRLVNIRI